MTASPKKPRKRAESTYTTRESTPMGGNDDSTSSNKSVVATVDENLQFDLQNTLSALTTAYMDGLGDADDDIAYENDRKENESKPANMWRKIQASLASYSSEDKQSINKTLAKEKDWKEYESSDNEPTVNISLERSYSEIRLSQN